MTKSKNIWFWLLWILILLAIGGLLFFKRDTNQANEYYYLTWHISYQDDAMLWEWWKPSSYYTVWLHINKKNPIVKNIWNVNSMDSNGEYTLLLWCVDKWWKILYANRTFTTGTSGTVDGWEDRIITGYNIIVIETWIKTNIPEDISGKIVGLSMTRPITAYPLIQDMPDAWRGMCEAYARVKDITIMWDYVEPQPIDQVAFIKGLPLCKEEILEWNPILTMDNLTKDCSTKESSGIVIDGLWGMYPEYTIADGQILTPSYDDVSLRDSTCKIGDWEYGPRDDSVRRNAMTWYAAVQKIIGKWLLNAIAPRENPDSMYCLKEDKECKAMIDYEWWTDWSNYFVAWYREPWSEDRKLLYVINGNIYYPGKTIEGTWFLKQTKWDFVWVKDNKIIVRRIINWKLPDWVSVDQALQHVDTTKTDISIETCTIDL